MQLLLIILSLLLSSVLPAQVQYACIEDGDLHIYDHQRGTSGFVIKNRILSSNINSFEVVSTDLPMIRGNKLRMVWATTGGGIICASTSYRSPNNTLSTIQWITLESEDTMVRFKAIERVADSIVSADKISREWAVAKANSLLRDQQKAYRLRPMTAWLECFSTIEKDQWTTKVIRNLTYDIAVNRDTAYILLLLGQWVELWKWDYINTQNEKSWARIKAYSIDRASDKSNELRCFNDYWGPSYSPASLADSTISVKGGRLKLIVQDGVFYIFNLSSGEVYHLGDRLKQIGTLELNTSEQNFFNQVLLVENKDKQVILYPGDYTWFKDIEIVPLIEQVDRAFLEAYFKGD